jgi:hypothetical protein
MGLKERAQQMASSAATVALATTGLSSCNDNGAVDPSPPPFACDRLGTTIPFLIPTATRAGDTITVTIRNGENFEANWQVSAVAELMNATVLSATLPAAPSATAPQIMTLRLQLASSTIAQASFVIEGQIVGRMNNVVCPYRRTYVLNISSTAVQISANDAIPLPLGAGEKAEIVLVRNEGRDVELQARTAYQGAHEISWSVTAGELDATKNPQVHWLLPDNPGVYQAELIVDYGDNGFAFDTLLLEVL